MVSGVGETHGGALGVRMPYVLDKRGGDVFKIPLSLENEGLMSSSPYVLDW